MEINLNSTGLGGIGMGREALDANGVAAGREMQGTAAIDAGRATRDTFTVSNAPIGLASAEPSAEVPDAALSRDDELGKLMNAAFNLPPPPMPTFD